ncbi:cilia- and flagella-associated protein 97-like [Ceratina calcarata]|uniref:Cilia- and flagella-associated protein 97-like n=1 Tax=Ceratina calcarata TaxID=156304 RepID=A0AAJ7JHL0_9HYME|nr:cilia- and flagella-associated protein 97-like [Ceratina calcarata]
MSCSEDIQPDCKCQLTLTLSNNIIREEFPEMRDSFNHVPSIHEVDEEETDEEYTYDQEGKNSDRTETEQTVALTKDTVDEDTIYSNDSFCSDESCDESEGTNASSRSLDDSHFSPQITNRQCIEESSKNEEKKCENAILENNITHSAQSEDEIEIRQIRNRRRNMSFTDDELRKIEWENQILLKKIMAQQRPKERILHENVPPTRISSSAINRKKLQKKIENENILLLQRIQRAKSRVVNKMTKPGGRQTIL